MKKKITAILMAAALTVSLAACAGSNTESAVTESASMRSNPGLIPKSSRELIFCSASS